MNGQVWRFGETIVFCHVSIGLHFSLVQLKSRSRRGGRFLQPKVGAA
jgi:hypothetical protein